MWGAFPGQAFLRPCRWQKCVICTGVKMFPLVHQSGLQELWYSAVASGCVHGTQLHPRCLSFLSPSNPESHLPHICHLVFSWTDRIWQLQPRPLLSSVSAHSDPQGTGQEWLWMALYTCDGNTMVHGVEHPRASRVCPHPTQWLLRRQSLSQSLPPEVHSTG